MFSSILAFEKVEGLPRTGTATPEVKQRLATATLPGPMSTGPESTRFEISLSKQVLFFYKDGDIARISHVSTGADVPYCTSRGCFDGKTPLGRFEITQSAEGALTDELGTVYNPLVFGPNDESIHGLESVPSTPASHGCVRVPMYMSEWLIRTDANQVPIVPLLTPVYVVP